MRFSTYINNQKALEWGLNASQAALFDLLNQASSWAEEIVIDGAVFYWVSRGSVIRELPLFYSKSDTVYRHFVDLSKKGLTVYLKHGEKDLIRLTEKGKTWNEFKAEQIRDNSEINPTVGDKLGNKSETTRKQIRDNSEINPTDNNTNYKNTNNHNNPLPLNGESANAEGETSHLGGNKKISKAPSINYSEIAQAYNDCVSSAGVNLPLVADPNNLSDKRKRAVKKLSAVMLKRFGDGSVDAFRDYFSDFIATANPFYFGENNRNWRADFEYLLRVETLDKTLERAL